MKIECLPAPSKRAVMTIYCEESPWRDIHTTIFGKTPILPNCLSLEEFAEKFAELEYRQAKQYVLRRLSAQSLPSAVLAKSLKERLVSPEIIDRLLEECQSWGMLNDDAWLESFVRTQLSRKNGPGAIALKLAAKGISRERIDQALEMAKGSHDLQHEAIKKLLLTRYRSRDLTNYAEKQKVIAALLRKGYSFEDVVKNISQIVVQ